MSFCLLLAALCAVAAAQPPVATAGPALPATWHGVWGGQLTVHTAGRKSFDRPMEIEIAPVRGGAAFRWKITSSINGKQSVRDYELVPDPDKPGEFQIDEKNGIRLRARLMGDALYSYFKDGDILITGRYERRGESLYVELASVLLNEPLVSKAEGAGIEIQSYRLGSVQGGELKRKK